MFWRIQAGKRIKYNDKENGMRKKKIFKNVIALMVIIMVFLQSGIIPAAAAWRTTPSVKYSMHIRDKGWMDYVSDGATAGTTGQSLWAEALKIKVSGMLGGITYRTHLKDIGWTSWSSNNRQSGTTGKKLRMEAVQIKLTGRIAQNYDVYYRVHLAEVGWLGWTKNGETAGSTGCGIQLEAIQIKLSSKSNTLNTSKAAISKPVLKVRAHVQNDGWLDPVEERRVAGTVGKGYRLEALRIECEDFLGGNGIRYRVHVEDDGWQNWCSSGSTAGTIGNSKRMEAIEIKLDGILEKAFDVYYRAHCADYGWLGWACNGETAGTTGGAKQMEAIQVMLVVKNESIDREGKAYYDLTGSANTNTGNTNTNTDNYAAYTTTDVRITRSPQVVDTFNGVQALYLPGVGNTNTGQYCCADFVAKYYNSVYRVNVWNMLTGRTPQASRGNFSVTTSPQAGDIGYHLNSGGYGHWFIVKAVNGRSCTVIEQNWKWASRGSTYCTVNRVVTQGQVSGLKFYHWNG